MLIEKSSVTIFDPGSNGYEGDEEPGNEVKVMKHDRVSAMATIAKAD